MALTKVTYSMIEGASVNVLDYGAVADGVTSNTIAFQAAINDVLLAGGGSVYIPQGVYWFPAGQKLDPGVGNITFYGEGMDASVLYYNEGTTVPGYLGNDHLFRNVANVTKKNLQFQNLQFRGTLNETTRAGRWANPLYLDYYPTLTISNCKFLNIAAEGMDIHFCGYFQCVESYFENIAADAIRVRDTPNCFVNNNYIVKNGDDAIAIHTSDGYTPTREGIIVTNNRIVNGGTIKILGGRVINVCNNQIELGNLIGIDIDDSSGPEGNIPLRDIVIQNNIILDGLDIGLSGVPISGSFFGIGISPPNPRGTALSGNAIPGDYSTVDAAFTFPWNYDELATNIAANPVARVPGSVISGNIIRRSRPAVNNFSDYGFGKRLFQGVPFNPSITNANLRMRTGIRLTGGINGLNCYGNIIECCSNGIEIETLVANNQYQRMIISENNFFDCINRGVLFFGGDFSADVSIINNTFNCDPYRQNSNSNIDGTYNADSVPRGIDSANVAGIKMIGNKFSNVCRAIATNILTRVFIRNNIFSCQPVATSVGFSNTNKGIGVLQNAAGNSYVYEIIDADPTSATYGLVDTFQYSTAGAQPSSGTWVVGAFVSNVAPAPDANNMMIFGWSRRTIGNGNVATTDWMPVLTSLVSPTV